jgi:signal transduction histidine kinase
MSRRSAAWLAWSLCSVSLVLLGLSVLLAFLGRPAPLLEESASWYGQAIFAAGSAGAPVLGALIASRHPENHYGWLWLGFGLALAILSFGGNYAEYAVLSGNLPASVTVAAVGSAGWVLWVALTPFLLLLFPDGRLPSPRWRFLVWTIVGAGAVCLALGPFTPGQSGIASVENPFGVGGRVGEVIFALIAAGVFVIFACTLLSALSLVFRYRRAGGVERQQIKWFTYAAVVFGAGLIFSGFLGQDLPGIWDAVFEAVPLSGLYVAVGIAIFRYRLYDIDLLINRTLVYGVLTAIVVGVYVLVVGYLGGVFQTEDSLLVSLAATGIVAVLFSPLRERLQGGVNRLMYGERDEPYAVVSRLGQRLEATLAPEAVLPTIVETVKEALKLPYAAISLKGNGPSEIVASVGKSVADPLRLPLLYQGEPVGELLLAPRTGQERFSAADRRLLSDLARQAGVAAHAVRLTADLQRSRERLVTAREEERRRLRRDLHDGLGPALSSVMLKLGAARRLLPSGSPADDLIVEVRDDMRATVADVRGLVYDLRPPALDQLGLVLAIDDYAEQCASEDEDGMRITVDAPKQVPPLPAAVEVAAYYIAREAITNTARHARARSCRVLLALQDGPERVELRLEITDDGVGLSDERHLGVGLSSMRERAEELGGKFSVESPPEGGTRVVARLPVGKE